jgi:hypothetical protein
MKKILASVCMFGCILKLYSIRPESANLLLLGVGLVVLPEFLRREVFRKQASQNKNLRDVDNNESVFFAIKVSYRYILNRLVFYVLTKCLRI